MQLHFFKLLDDCFVTLTVDMNWQIGFSDATVDSILSSLFKNVLINRSEVNPFFHSKRPNKQNWPFE